MDLMTNMKRRYTDQGYAEELQEIRERLVLMAGRVENIIEAALQALVDRDVERALSLIHI